MQSVYLIRHAKTKANKYGVLCGRTESEIIGTIEDIKNEIEPKLETLKSPVIISSPLKRAVDTASVFERKIITDEGFLEFDFGKFEGKSFEYIKQNHSAEFEKLLEEGNDYQYPDGENLVSFLNRVSNAYDKVLEEYSNYKELVIVSHAGVIQMLLSYILTGDKTLYWNFKIKNCAVIKLYYCEGLPVIEYIK